MSKIKLLSFLFLYLVFGVGVHSEEKALTSFKDVAGYIKEFGKLPDNFITKKEAQGLGWEPRQGNLWDVAPGKSIGGDRFQNREKKLPHEKGRTWFEADIDYQGGRRGAKRILFSNDRLIYKTTDHYKTFIRMD